MNHVAEENVQNINICSQKTSNSKKNCNAKDSSVHTEEINLLNKENKNESLESFVHINNIDSHLTNGISEHPHEKHSLSLGNGSHDDYHAQIDTHEQSTDVNSVNNSENNVLTDKGCARLHIVRDLVEEALQNLETALNIQDSPAQENINIISYESEKQMPEIMRLIQKDLSEPYSIYTYRYFIHNWPKLCFLATHDSKCIGAIVCKLDLHRNVVRRGYIAMLAVDEKYRKRKIGSKLVRKAIQAMIEDNADEVVLETEITNKPALKLYENLGFVRDKRLFRYYLNGVDALRLKLWLR